MAVPYTFGSATTSIPLSQLDSNFATAITLGNTAVQLGNTITTLTGLTSVTTSGDSTISGLTVGKGGGAVSTNTAVGASALTANTTGNYQTAIGYQAGTNLTTGAQTTFIGGLTGQNQTTGSYNVAMGINAFVGSATIANNTGGFNTAIGTGTLNANSSGNYNTGLGMQALNANTTASNNTAVGYQALYSNTTGNQSVALGYQAGYSMATNFNLTAIGFQSLQNATGNNNTAVGQYSGNALTSGANNTFIGQSCGSAITTGGKNSIIGNYNGNTGGLDIRTSSNYIVLSDGDGNPRGIFDSGGQFLVGKVAGGISNTGFQAEANGSIGCTRSANVPLDVNRVTDDGTLVLFRQDNTAEGSISVSGTTVSYNGGHLSRYAQTTTVKDESIVKGTVLSNLDAMNVYTDADGNPVANEQLNKVKVSDVDGDVNVAGVFVNWSHDEDHNVDEINMAMTGDMIIRIAQGTTVARGDLLMSAGDGTAKPQNDDIVRSKTVAKVTSTHIICTYADGSYCVPCVLMAC